MRRCLEMAMTAAVVAVLAAAGAARADEISQAAALWEQMRSAQPDTADFKSAQWKLTALVGTTAKAKHVEMATAMMDRSAPPGVNEAAIALFGKDPFPVVDIQRMLSDPQRSFDQRELIKTIYRECRPEGVVSLLSEPVRKQLVAVLAARLDKLAGTPIHYGEQRLFVHLISSVLSRYPATSQAPEGVQLVSALAKYADKAGRSDTLGAAIPVWLDLRRNPVGDIETFSHATRLLGHWDPVMRLKAADWLSDRMDSDPKIAQIVTAMLDDIRDEARAAAVRVFGFARDYKPETIVPKEIILLTQDISTVVQKAAADTLSARADQATDQIQPLLDVLSSPARRLGNNRTSCILMVLSRLVSAANKDQKASMIEVASLRLRTSPDGALALLEALGPEAESAVPAIKDYRGSADRDRKAYIDRHVLPAIEPTAASSN